MNAQGQYLTETHTEYCHHQDELKNISIKQIQVLNQALEVLCKNDKD